MGWVILAIVGAGVLVLVLYYLSEARAATLIRKLQNPDEPLSEAVDQLLRLVGHDDVRKALTAHFGPGFEQLLKGLVLVENRTWDELDGIGPSAVDALLLYGRSRVLAEPHSAGFCETMRRLIHSHAPHLREQTLRNACQMVDVTETWKEEIPATHDCGGGCAGIGCCGGSSHYSTYITHRRSVDCSSLRAIAQTELENRSRAAATIMAGYNRPAPPQAPGTLGEPK